MSKMMTLKEKITQIYREYSVDIACGYLVMSGNVYAANVYSELKK